MKRTAINASGFLYRVKKFSMTCAKGGPDEGRSYQFRPLVYELETLLNRNLSQEFKVAEHFSRAQHHAGQWIVRNGNRQPGFFADSLVQVLQQCAAARQDNAAVANVCAQLRRCALQGNADRVHDGADALAQSFANFTVVNG